MTNMLYKKRKLYGRRRGRLAFASFQAPFFENELEDLYLKCVSHDENPKRLSIDVAKLRKNYRELWLEIGFGGGEHLLHMAKLNPQVLIIGCEPFADGVVMLLKKLAGEAVQNVLIYPGDVRDLFDVLPNGCIHKAFLNYPDPWPKVRHHRRRFVNPDYLEPFYKICSPGAEFRLASDVPSYVEQALLEVPKVGFRLQSFHEGKGAWSDWITTRYEAKAQKERRVPHYITFIREK